MQPALNNGVEPIWVPRHCKPSNRTKRPPPNQGQGRPTRAQSGRFGEWQRGSNAKHEFDVLRRLL
jgi:hypothetical protein